MHNFRHTENIGMQGKYLWNQDFRRMVILDFLVFLSQRAKISLNKKNAQGCQSGIRQILKVDILNFQMTSETKL